MKNNIVELPSEYEEMINKLESQISELFSEIHYYQALLTEKENTIIRLTTENRYLKAQMQTVSSKLTPVPAPPQKVKPPFLSNQSSHIPTEHPQQLNHTPESSQRLYTPPPSPPPGLNPPSPSNQPSYISSSSHQFIEQTIPSSEDSRVNKRVCPECGAMGFAIKEVDDRTRVISYNPQKIYAKKKVCTKCRTEFV